MSNSTHFGNEPESLVVGIIKLFLGFLGLALIGTLGFGLALLSFAAIGLLTFFPIVAGILLSACLAVLTIALALNFYDILKNSSEFSIFKKMAFGLTATFYAGISGLLLYKFTHISALVVSAGFAHVMAGIGFGALAVGLPLVFILPLVVISASVIYRKLTSGHDEAKPALVPAADTISIAGTATLETTESTLKTQHSSPIDLLLEASERQEMSHPVLTALFNAKVVVASTSRAPESEDVAKLSPSPSLG